MAEFKKVLSASLGGGVLLLERRASRRETINLSTSAATNTPVLTGSETTIAHYYGSGGSNYTDSSANFTPAQNNHTDPTFGLSTFADDPTDYAAGDVHGNQYMIGQSFTTGTGYNRLNQIGVVFGDADNGANFSTSSETIHLFRVDTVTGNLTPVGSYTGTGTPYEAKTSFKNTNINFTNGPILAPNTTYAFTVTENSTGAVALIIPKGTSPAGTTSQQLVSVYENANGAGENPFLTYSGYTSRNNSSGNAANSPAETGTEYTSVTNPKASSTGENTNLLNPGSPTRRRPRSVSLRARIAWPSTRLTSTWSLRRFQSPLRSAFWPSEALDCWPAVARTSERPETRNF